ncbi:MAG: hypothetical protein K0S32_2528 [Bacteroidetes bacterium]|jgi:RimJ/RimL family protein N-acetyltransferase|nr:hypothetical protein [Bacteroidota bacterium]
MYIYEDNLETPRLITRKLEETDRDTLVEFFSDKDCTEFLSRVMVDNDPVATSERWIAKQLGRYSENRYGLQVLIEKRTGDFIGQCGLLAQEVNGVKELEVGYHIFKKHWGKGYAPEAAMRFMKYAFDNGLADSVISIIHVDNIKSQKVALKNGLKKDKVIRYNNLDVVVYRMDKSDFKGF